MVYQARALGSVLSVDLRTASGGVIPLTESSRAVLSASRQPAVSISSMVPPPWKALAQPGWRAESHALSPALMASRPARGALWYRASWTASIRASALSIFAS